MCKLNKYVLYDFPNTPEGQLNKNLRAMLAEYEREKIAQRMTRGRHRRVKEGHVLTGPKPPFGYRVTLTDDGKRGLEVVEAEAAIIHHIFELYVYGNADGKPLSGNAIANLLTSAKRPQYQIYAGRVLRGANAAKGYGRKVQLLVSWAVKLTPGGGIIAKRAPMKRLRFKCLR